MDESEFAKAEGMESLLNIDVGRQGRLLEKLEAEVRETHLLPPPSKSVGAKTLSVCGLLAVAIAACGDWRAHFVEARKGTPCSSTTICSEADLVGVPDSVCPPQGVYVRSGPHVMFQVKDKQRLTAQKQGAQPLMMLLSSPCRPCER
jgi:hypothetical protein